MLLRGNSRRRECTTSLCILLIRQQAQIIRVKPLAGGRAAKLPILPITRLGSQSCPQQICRPLLSPPCRPRSSPAFQQPSLNQVSRLRIVSHQQLTAAPQPVATCPCRRGHSSRGGGVRLLRKVTSGRELGTAATQCHWHARQPLPNEGVQRCWPIPLLLPEVTRSGNCQKAALPQHAARSRWHTQMHRWVSKLKSLNVSPSGMLVDSMQCAGLSLVRQPAACWCPPWLSGWPSHMSYCCAE